MIERHKPPCLALAMTLMVAAASLARASRSVLLSRPIDDLLLEQHNIFRQEEKASNIYKMHWNKTVAQAAGEWASQCQFKHKLSGPYGENLFYSSDPSFEDFDIREILLGGMELWHDEKRGWRYSSDACGAACHYTQMVWYSTTSVGCAHQMCHGLTVGRRSVDRALYLVCFYYPRGNWVGEYPFKTGRPCSNCDGTSSCQDGLCVEETSSYSSFHTQTENEVKSGSTWNWNYKAEGRDSHHQASSFRNVSSVTSRDPARNGYRHTSSSHSRHDVSIRTPSGHHSHRTTSSVYRVSHSSRNRQTGRTQPSGGSVERDFESYSPSRSRLQNTAPAGLRQSPRQAQYAPTAPERASSRIGSNSNRRSSSSSNNNNRRSSSSSSNQSIQRDASSRLSKSPLDIIHGDTHWCRDRLPSCRIWKGECQKSKAVYLSCPRTCGHCGRNKANGNPDSHRNRTPPSPQPSPYTSTPHRRSHHRQQPRGPQQFRQQQQQQQRTHPQRRPSQAQQRPDSTSQPQYRRLPPPRQTLRLQNSRSRDNPQHELRETRRGRKKMDREHSKRQGPRRRPGRGQQPRKGRRKGQRQRQHQQQRKGQRQGHRQRNGGKRRRPGVERRRENRRRRHRKFQNVDRRAEELATELQIKALNGGRCEDDPKYTRSCPVWVSKGFCDGNVLVSNVYCKVSCGSC